MLRRLHVGLSFAIALVFASVFASGSAVAASTTLWVNDDSGPGFPPGTSCDHPGFATIQSAVNAAPPGARINVCPGTYTEQVTVPAGKDGLSLRSVGHWQAVIKAPPLMAEPKAIVRVNVSRNVTLLAFTIAGPGGFGCDSLRWGVRVDGDGSANVLGNHIVDIRDNPFSGCQNGVGVQVGRNLEGQTGSADIIGNVIERYQKNGMTIDNVGSSAEIAHNRVLGAGSTPTIAQNGIQVSRGATADIQHNFVGGNAYTGLQPAASTGVLFFDPSVVQTRHNTVTTNDVGIWMILTDAGSETSHNRVRASTFDGVALDSADGSSASQNKIYDNAGPGIGTYASTDNSIADNHVEDNEGSGILLADDSTGNTVSDNKVKDNGTGGSDSTDGIRVELGSTGNTIDGNKLRDNVTHDCHDFNAAGNTWSRNHGETSEPPGVCGRDDNDADFAETTAYGWDASYPWYAGMPEAAEYDWAAAYAAIDTNALLQLVPQLGLHPARTSPVPSN